MQRDRIQRDIQRDITQRDMQRDIQKDRIQRDRIQRDRIQRDMQRDRIQRDRIQRDITQRDMQRDIQRCMVLGWPRDGRVWSGMALGRSCMVRDGPGTVMHGQVWTEHGHATLV